MGWGTRIAAALLVLVTVGFVFAGSASLMDSNRFVDPIGVNINGEWEFQNRASPDCADRTQPSGVIPCFVKKTKEKWPFTVDVPKPLNDQIKEPLANEFWYKKTVQLSSNLLTSGEDLSITLGSTKGRYSIWINGNFLAAGLELSLANHPLPSFLLPKDGKITVVARIAKTDVLFPGIVHFTPMQIGRSKYLAKQNDDFYFQSAAKPLIPTIFKVVLFITFMALFVAVPVKREYLFFSLYCFFSALVSFFYWRYQPFYSDYFFRQKLIFIATMLSAACVPLFVVEFFRFHRTLKIVATIYAAIIAESLFLSLYWIPDNSKRVLLYQMSYQAIPWLIYLPAIIFSFSCSAFLFYRLGVKHRAIQGLLLSGCFIVSLLFTHLNVASLLSFQKLLSPELIDISVFLALAALMIGDFKSLYSLLQKSRNALPAIVSKLFAVGAKQAIVEFQAVAIVVDVVGYTKKLEELSTSERDQYNSQIKSILAPIIFECNGDKLSDTGDGGVYAWEFKTEEQKFTAIESALSAAIQITERGKSNCGVDFRIGVALGEIKCHFNAPNYSFLGDPINTAARLEASAGINQVLVHESVPTGQSNFCGGNLVTYIAKGAPFKARLVAKSLKELSAA